MKIGAPEWKRLLEEGGKQMGIGIGPDLADQLSFHAEALAIWADKINLTAIRDPLEVAVKHYLDSLAPANMIPSNAILLDAGTGAGFPGIPLKIVIPSVSATLVDASRKKVSFLKHVIRAMGLKKMEALQGRIEDLPPKPLYDVIVSRAMSDLEAFVIKAGPLLRFGGRFIAFKGKDVREEIDRLKRRLPVRVEIHPYRLPFIDSERLLVVICPVIRPEIRPEM
jgi:16S rRNA (guanine527-N7)-methyltransferase